jgi:cobalt-zinc-cadmium resistance protein CzcA
VQRPLAAVVVGGMFIGPIILLVVVPALQTLLAGEEDGSSPGPGTEGPETAAADT